MGAVYEAVDTRLRNTVAVKQLEIAGAAADRAFEREAQLLAGLRHPVLPVVIDYFSAASDAFLVMQYIEGENLEDHLKRQSRPCSHDEVLAWANVLLDGLAYLHSRTPSIIHRDIKPANVKRTPTGDIVLLDFGLAKGRLDSDPTVSPDSGLYGFTLQYAPPEQIDGHPTDVRSDLFALGATLYHLATGTPPPSALQRSMAVRNGARDPLVAADEIYPPVGPELSAALTRALQLDPADRFGSAAEMRAALSALGAPAVPRAEPTTAERRVDAALPTHVEVGRQTDLIVQVRFADSPLLGIEDWPTARRPERVEQQSEPLHVRHLVDATGRLLPARVRIRIVAADFAIEGDAERVIEVPVNDYSKRMAFLLTPQRAGYCRVNVEVYALDSLFLGTVAVEAEAVSAQVTEAVPTVAHVVLGTFARRAAAPKSAASGVSATADTVRIKITPELAAAIAAPPVGAPAQRDMTTAATMLAAPVPMEPSPAPSSTVAVSSVPATTHVPPAPPRASATPDVPVAPPPVAAPSPAMSRVPVAAPSATPPMASAPPPRASFASRLPMFGSAAAAILLAGVVYTVWPQFSRSLNTPPETSSTPTPTAAPAPTAAAPAAAPPPASPVPAAAPTTPAAASTREALREAARAADASRQTSSPSPVNARPPATPPRSTPTPDRVPALPRPAPVAAPPPPPAAAPLTPAAPPAPAALPPSTAAPPPSPAAPPAPAAPPPSPAAPPPSPAAPALAANAGGTGSARVMEAAKKLEQSGELAQALAEYERARQLLEVDVARLKEALQNGLVTPRRVEAAEAALNDATQSIARVRARLDAQRRKK